MRILVWDETLAKGAQTYANTMVFEHSINAGYSYGENIS